MKPDRQTVNRGRNEDVLVPTVDRPDLHYHRERMAGIPLCGPMANHYERRARDEAAEYAEPCSRCFADELRADGGVDVEPDEDEFERRARQAANSLVVWPRRADLDPVDVLESVRDDYPDGESEQSGAWVGSVNGLTVREPGPDADGPILQLHGKEGMAAVEFDDEMFVVGLTHAAAQIQTVFDDSLGAETEDVDRGDGPRADGGTETVYMTSRKNGPKQRIHTDQDCISLQRANKVFERPREAVEGNFEICTYCKGEFEPHGPEGDSSRRRKELLKTEPEELGLSPMGDGPNGGGPA